MNDETSQNPTPPAATANVARPGLRDRVLGWRGVVGVALASVILGGVGGAVLGVVSDGGDENGMRGGPGGFGNPGRGMPAGTPAGVPAGIPAQLPPGTAPQQDDGSSS